MRSGQIQVLRRDLCASKNLRRSLQQPVQSSNVIQIAKYRIYRKSAHALIAEYWTLSRMFAILVRYSYLTSFYPHLPARRTWYCNYKT